MKWIMDFCAQSLREIIIGMGGKSDGFMMNSGFAIAVSSEIMAILAVSKDMKDMRDRMGKIVVAYDKGGKPVTTQDLEVAGAMTAWMVEALNPNLMQTIEGQPVLVHAGPFANIAIGQSSIIADRMGLKLADYHITESGFGADIGFEKFWNLKCRFSGLKPQASVIVATIRALKCHGGAPIPVPGRPMPEEYRSENVAWVEKGCENLVHHIRTVKKAGINPVVCINAFFTDTDNEINSVRRLAEEAGARVALSKHWQYGGEGALELADAVIDACNEPNDFRFLYDLSTPLRKRIELIAKEVYGADGVEFSQDALAKAKENGRGPGNLQARNMHGKNPSESFRQSQHEGCSERMETLCKGYPFYKGAGFVVPVAGAIKLMPGTAQTLLQESRCRRRKRQGQRSVLTKRRYSERRNRLCCCLRFEECKYRLALTESESSRETGLRILCRFSY